MDGAICHLFIPFGINSDTHIVDCLHNIKLLENLIYAALSDFTFNFWLPSYLNIVDLFSIFRTMELIKKENNIVQVFWKDLFWIQTDFDFENMKLKCLLGLRFPSVIISFLIQDYSVSETTLEQIFLGFARSEETTEIWRRRRSLLSCVLGGASFKCRKPFWLFQFALCSV